VSTEIIDALGRVLIHGMALLDLSSDFVYHEQISERICPYGTSVEPLMSEFPTYLIATMKGF